MSLKSKIKLLDNVFSQFIRFRDTDENGYGKCVSCDAIKHYFDLDAGHYINRKYMSLRYSEINVNAQCYHCNRFDEGNSSGYALGIIKKYDERMIGALEIAKHQTYKRTEFELKVMIDHYRELNKQFNKNFKVKLI